MRNGNYAKEHSMRRLLLSLLVCISFAAAVSAQQKLSVRWEELTAADFRQAIEQSKGTCILPIGILEKHGPHPGHRPSERPLRFFTPLKNLS
jgi:hypothetical protein